MGHHYVPQKYLEGFGVQPDAKTIWQFDKQRRSWTPGPVPIRDVAQERGYFDPEIEKVLSESIEAPANRILDKLRRGELPTPAERVHFALYIGCMLMRVPGRRRKAEALIPDVLEKTIARLRDELEDAYQRTGDEIYRTRLAELSETHERYRRQPPPGVFADIRRPRPARNVLEAIVEMSWWIHCTEGPSSFLTTDNPAYFLESYGLGTEKAQLMFPLSTDRLLFGSKQGDPQSTVFLRGRRNVPQILVRDANRYVASGAERYVYYHEKARWIETLAMHPRGPRR